MRNAGAAPSTTEAEYRTPPSNLRERDAARYLGLSTSYLRKARRFGRGPTYIHLGRAIRYAVSDLQAWLAQHRVSSAA